MNMIKINININKTHLRFLDCFWWFCSVSPIIIPATYFQHWIKQTVCFFYNLCSYVHFVLTT